MTGQLQRQVIGRSRDAPSRMFDSRQVISPHKSRSGELTVGRQIGVTQE